MKIETALIVIAILNKQQRSYLYILLALNQYKLIQRFEKSKLY